MDDLRSSEAQWRGEPITVAPVDAGPLVYDLLTGLVSREVFDSQLTRVLERTWRTPTSVAVLLLHVGDLRLINDRFRRLVEIGRAHV